jgi:hypothetical protein
VRRRRESHADRIRSRSVGRVAFFIATHHENPELDQLIIEHGGTRSAKLPGEPARIALGSDPRNS